jgi:thermolysin
MRKLSFFALGIVAAGCSADPQSSSNEPVAPGISDPGVTTAQLSAFGQLQNDTGRAWTWMQHEALSTPMHLAATRTRTGKPLLTAGVSPEKATLAFVGQYKDLFKIRDAAAELAVAKSEVDHLAMTHVRFQQITHGIPVVGAELAAHYDGEGRVTSIDANYIAGIEGLDLEPKLTAQAGKELALADVVARTKDVEESQLHPSDGKLVVFALGNHPATLAYEYTVRAVYGSEPAIWVTTVDAKTGAIIDRYNNLQTVEATANGVLGNAQKFQVTAAGTGYQMLDTSRGVQIRTYNAGGLEIGPAEGAKIVSSTSLASWDTGTGAGAAVDAHTYAAVVFDYYKTVHARNAIDGAGGPMLSTAHFGQAYDNAFWDGTGMAYGDGGPLYRPLSAGLDVVAHEFTHGITEKTSNLRYQGQSGALNEAVSDIFGVFIEHAAKPDEVKNWTMGESIIRAGGTLRDFKNPGAGQQPANMSTYVNTQQDEGGVHINSGIINNAAFLMTVGGVNPVSKIEVKLGIGWEKSEKLWYRANTKYFLSTTNFAQAAQGVMQAAKDIGLTANEQNVVDCAWKATGIVQGACATLTATSTQPEATPGAVPGTGAGAATDTGTGGADTTPDDTSGTGTTTPAKKKTTPRMGLSAANDSGCNVSTQKGSTDLGPLAGLLAAVFALARGRRRAPSRRGEAE